MELLLPCSVPICHIPLFISINYHKKSGCLLSINRNHSPVVYLIMRPHTELTLDAAHHCLGQPASNLSPQFAGELRTEGDRCRLSGFSWPAGTVCN